MSTVVEEKPTTKKSKKSKKPQPKKVVEEDLDSILKEMGLEGENLVEALTCSTGGRED